MLKLKRTQTVCTGKVRKREETERKRSFFNFFLKKINFFWEKNVCVCVLRWEPWHQDDITHSQTQYLILVLQKGNCYDLSMTIVTSDHEKSQGHSVSIGYTDVWTHIHSPHVCGHTNTHTHTHNTHTSQTHTYTTHIHRLQREREREKDTHTHT